MNTSDEHDPEPGTEPKASTPRRQLRDPRELRALAHPLRLSLLENLATLGQATATELARLVDESPANCSWHLRQLARYGYIEEAGGGRGRARPWRWVPEVQEISAPEDATPEMRVARDAVVGVMFDRDVDAWRAWDASRDDAPKAWREASFTARGMNWLTAYELAAFKRDLDELVERHLVARFDRVDPRRRPSGAHLVRILAGGFPAGRPSDLHATMSAVAADVEETGGSDGEGRG